MKFFKTEIDGPICIILEPRFDERGHFARIFCKNEFKKEGIEFDIVQINRSLTRRKGIIRGLHFQTKPYQEDKLIQCISGKIYDIAVDMREDSKTFGKWVAQELSEDNNKMFFIPKGFAHGFQSLTDNCIVQYFVSEFYSPQSETGVRWDDPFFNITWPIKDPSLSEKDRDWSLI